MRRTTTTHAWQSYCGLLVVRSDTVLCDAVEDGTTRLTNCRYDHYCRYDHLFARKVQFERQMRRKWEEIHTHVGTYVVYVSVSRQYFFVRLAIYGHA